MRAAAESFLERKMAAVRRTRPARPEVDALRRRAGGQPPAPSFDAALRAGSTVTLIAEYKRRSPSAGRLVPGGDPADVAVAYAAAGARAVSVLTDGNHFGGSLPDLERAARATGLPVLRKDFLVDAAGLYEARLAGAAAALLIVAALSPQELRGLLRAGEEVGLACLVEVHDEAELDAALEAGARTIGINNRDLRTLTTDLRTAERLAPAVPAGTTVVAESGIRTAGDVARMAAAGAHAVLVGEAILRAPPGSRPARVRELAGVPRP